MPKLYIVSLNIARPKHIQLCTGELTGRGGYLQDCLVGRPLEHLFVRRGGRACCIPAVRVRLEGAGRAAHRGGMPLEGGAGDGAVGEASGDGHFDGGVWCVDGID